MISVMIRVGWRSLKVAASLPEWLTDCRQAAVLINKKMRDKNKGKAINGLPQAPPTYHGRVGAKSYHKRICDHALLPGLAPMFVAG